MCFRILNNETRRAAVERRVVKAVKDWLGHAPFVRARRIDPKRLRYCAGVRLTWRRNNRLKNPASS